MTSTARRIAVTGALGFVGSRLLPRLAARGDHVVAIVRPGRDAAALERTGHEVRFADLDDPRTVSLAFEGVDALVHLSGLAQISGLVPVLERTGPRRGVFVSSAGVHTKLPSASAEAKRRGEAALRSSGLEWTILRPSMIYGTPGDRNVARLLLWIRRWPVVFVPGGGGTAQQPVHVDDLVAAILAALDRPAAIGREYEVGGPEAMSLREVVRTAAQSLGRRVVIVPLPIGPVHVAVVALRRLGLGGPVRPEQVLRLGESKAVDISAARRDLSFEPRPFTQGVGEEARQLSRG